MSDRVELLVPSVAPAQYADQELDQLLAQPVEQRPPVEQRLVGVLVGTLIGFRDPYEPLVIYPGQPGTAALIARASVDLHPEHIGSEVMLLFENGDPQRPIVTGRIRVPCAWPASEPSTHVDVDADGKRLILTAKDQLVLRCGKASITLTAAGKVLIHGTYVSNRSTSVLRLKGGAVQIN